MLKRITKREARKLFATGTATFVICPHKFYPHGAFSMGCVISGREYLADAERYRDNPVLWKGTLEATAWQLMYNNWAYYNASYETGYYASYWVESEAPAAPQGYWESVATKRGD